MKFSIIVPVYNIEEKIERCLTSLLCQDYDDCEFIVVVDGATDDSLRICKKIAMQDTRVKIFYKKNGGLVSARKFGAKLANGDYIINVDGDDYIENGYLQQIEKIVDEYNPDVIAIGFNEICSETSKCIINYSKDGYYTGSALEEIKKRFVYDGTQKGFKGGCLIASIWSKIIKKSIYVDNQMRVPEYISVGEDIVLNSFILDSAMSIYVDNSSYYNYVVYESSMMHKYNLNNLKHYLDAAEQLAQVNFNTENAINLYLLQGLISEIRKCAKLIPSYSEFKEVFCGNKVYNEIQKRSMNAKLDKLSNMDAETAVKIAIVKINNLRLMYYICKYS